MALRAVTHGNDDDLYHNIAPQYSYVSKPLSKSIVGLIDDA